MVTKEHRGVCRKSPAPVGAERSTSRPGEIGERVRRHSIMVLEKFEDGGYETAVRFMAPIKDLGSLSELREAIGGRGPRAWPRCKRIMPGSRSIPRPIARRCSRRCSSSSQSDSFTCTRGDLPMRPRGFETALETAKASVVPATVRSRLKAVLGIVAMRRGEIENCLECAGPSSCIFPIASQARHQNPAGLARSHQVVHGVSGGVLRGTCESSGF